ncbi:hypothetical protein GCM10010404_90940 [Nonomuraea africana]|uniref:Uncharacterized protein n=1 Tax=Nonomuraea africana TaxID=46171 RepID=A0ABR9KEE8_9ACTN|nr:hypothetical protein [Nonomuraea africana]MBE1560038.1 hypothetical protein [Nonomuraea africana]
MPKDHARKHAARRRQRATGGSYTSAAAGTLHSHPVPDLRFLADLPFHAGEKVDLKRAALLVGACRAGCSTCQGALIPMLLADERAPATVALLAGAAYAPWLATSLPAASSTTRAWVPLQARTSWRRGRSGRHRRRSGPTARPPSP